MAMCRFKPSFLHAHELLREADVFLGLRVGVRQLGGAQVRRLGEDLALLAQAVVGRLDRGEVGAMAVDCLLYTSDAADE